MHGASDFVTHAGRHLCPWCLVSRDIEGLPETKLARFLTHAGSRLAVRVSLEDFSTPRGVQPPADPLRFSVCASGLAA